jgi:hypothetical protein
MHARIILNAIVIRCNVSVYLILLGAFGIGTNVLELS